MASTKISDMTAATDLVGATIPIVQDGVNKKASITLFSDYFNVETYGAVHDGVTDDTVAIQAAIDACFAAGGGVVYFPAGIYIIGGALVTSVDSINPNAQLVVPLNNGSGLNNSIGIKFLGEAPQFTANGPLVNVDMDKTISGVILKSTILGTGTEPAVLGSSFFNDGFVDTNVLGIVIENINIQVRSKTAGVDIAPTMGAFKLKYFAYAQLLGNNSAFIESNLWESVEPTSVGCIGFYMPQATTSGNYGSITEAANALGFYYGFVIQEHDYVAKMNAVCCVYGYNIGFLTTAHPFKLNLFAFGCKNSLRFAGGCRIDISLYIERYATAGKWYTGVDDIVFNSTPTINGVLNVMVGANGGTIRVLDINGTWAGTLRINSLDYMASFLTPESLGGSGWIPLNSTFNLGIHEIKGGIVSGVSEDVGFAVSALTHPGQSNLTGVVAAIQSRNLAIAGAEKRSHILVIANNGAINTSMTIEYLLLAGVLTQIAESTTTRRKLLTRLCVDKDITPTALAANTDNWAPTNFTGCSTIRASASAAYNLTGLAIGQVDGDEITLINIGANNITLMNNVTSTAANRFLLNADFILLPEAACRLVYDGTSSRWRKLY